MRLALVGAFAFPAPRGSQWLLGAQARALREGGAEVAVVCYGAGVAGGAADPAVVAAPRALSPRSPLSPRKPLADLALAAALARAHRARPFDALLAHNAEAALACLAARRALGVPVVYVAHTLWREELPFYLPPRLRRGRARAAAARLGAALDARCARGADAVLALSSAAERALAPLAEARVARIPPGLAREPAPGPAEVEAAAKRHGLEPRHYIVYAGNLDGYQGLELLDAAAARAPELPVVAATHDRGGGRLRALRFVRAASPAEARALVHGARLAALPRRARGGFPLKLLAYLDAGLPVVAFAGVADTLSHGDSAWLLDERAGPGELAAALRRLFGDAALRARLGDGAVRALAAEHAWPPLARRTLDLVEDARRCYERRGLPRS